MKKRVYISGRISDLPREQYMKMFGIAETMLRDKGYKPVNPTRLWPCRWWWVYPLLERVVGGKTAYCCVIAYDLWRLHRCDGIFMMFGSGKSRGARLERLKARQWNIETIEL